MDDDDYMYFAGSVNASDPETVPWFDNDDDAKQDAWLGLLSGERDDPGRL